MNYFDFVLLVIAGIAYASVTIVIITRIDAIKYALACDNEANRHYGLKPSALHRAGVIFKAIWRD